MLGSIAGNIIGSPYRSVNADDRFFNIFEDVRVIRGGRLVSFGVMPTRESYFSMAVSKWLMESPSMDADDLRRIADEMLPGGVDSVREGDAAALLLCGTGPVGKFCDSLEASLLASERMCGAFGVTEKRDMDAVKALSQCVWMSDPVHGREQGEGFASMSDYPELMELVSDPDLRHLSRGFEKVRFDDGTVGWKERRSGQGRDALLVAAAAVKAFSDADSFEYAVRRAVEFGGGSETVACVAGGLADARFGVPEKIDYGCQLFLDSDLKSRMSLFERVCRDKSLLKDSSETVAEGVSLQGVMMLRMDGMKPVYFVDGAARDAVAKALEKKDVSPDIRPLKDLRDCLAKAEVVAAGRPAFDEHRFGADWADRAEAKELKDSARLFTLEEYFDAAKADATLPLSVPKEHAYLSGPLPEVRKLYLQDGSLKSILTVESRELVPQDRRMFLRQVFEKSRQAALNAKAAIDRACGIDGSLTGYTVAFPTNCRFGGTKVDVYYPVAGSQFVEIRKSGLVAGRLSIDQNTAQLKVVDGDYEDGEYREAAWCKERVLKSWESADAAIASYCLDRGAVQKGEADVLASEKARQISRNEDEREVQIEKEAKLGSNLDRAAFLAGVSDDPWLAKYSGKAVEGLSFSRDMEVVVDSDQSKQYQGSLFTLGIGNMQLGEFERYLERYGIEVVVDVRAGEKCSFNPKFNSQYLAKALDGKEVDYLHFGGKNSPEDMSVRRSEPECLGIDGTVDWTKVPGTEKFQRGWKRIAAGLEAGVRIAVVDGVSSLETSPRVLVIGRYAESQGVDVRHINRQGRLVSQKAAATAVLHSRGYTYSEANVAKAFAEVNREMGYNRQREELRRKGVSASPEEIEARKKKTQEKKFTYRRKRY